MSDICETHEINLSMLITGPIDQRAFAIFQEHVSRETRRKGGVGFDELLMMMGNALIDAADELRVEAAAA